MKHKLGVVMVAVSILTISGCATNKDQLLPHGEATMLDVWDQGTGGIGDATGGRQQSRQLMDARQALRRPVQSAAQLSANQMSYTRNAHNEVVSQFPRLPNPDLVMYVFPHLTGTDPVPVPGYSTVFPLYQRIQYAMPGERTEPY